MLNFAMPRAAFLIWPNVWSFVLTLVVVAVVIALIVRARQGSNKEEEVEAYPQTASVRTNVQSAKPAEPAKTETQDSSESS